MTWDAIAAIVAVLAFIFTVFIQWPSFKTRLDEVDPILQDILWDISRIMIVLAGPILILVILLDFYLERLGFAHRLAPIALMLYLSFMGIHILAMGLLGRAEDIEGRGDVRIVILACVYLLIAVGYYLTRATEILALGAFGALIGWGILFKNMKKVVKDLLVTIVVGLIIGLIVWMWNFIRTLF